ncbi:MAG: hypothetical protein AAFU49_02520 [Pseudomonadota bacterium]
MPSKPAPDLAPAPTIKGKPVSKGWRHTKGLVVADLKKHVAEYGKDDPDARALAKTLAAFKSGLAPTLEKLEKAKKRDDQLKQAKKIPPIVRQYTQLCRDGKAAGEGGAASYFNKLEGMLDVIEKEVDKVIKAKPAKA